MKCLKMEGRFYVHAVVTGASINETIAEAISLSDRYDGDVQFWFNGVTVRVSRVYSKPDLIYQDYLRAHRGLIGKTIGPSTFNSGIPPFIFLTDKEKKDIEFMKPAENTVDLAPEFSSTRNQSQEELLASTTQEILRSVHVTLTNDEQDPSIGDDIE